MGQKNWRRWRHGPPTAIFQTSRGGGGGGWGVSHTRTGPSRPPGSWGLSFIKKIWLLKGSPASACPGGLKGGGGSCMGEWHVCPSGLRLSDGVHVVGHASAPTKNWGGTFIYTGHSPDAQDGARGQAHEALWYRASGAVRGTPTPEQPPRHRRCSHFPGVPGKPSGAESRRRRAARKSVWQAACNRRRAQSRARIRERRAAFCRPFGPVKRRCASSGAIPWAALATSAADPAPPVIWGDVRTPSPPASQRGLH